ncbi:Gfo/Idh/MocA family oxidoreductase [Halobacillus fulvus]|nr:Gfo/Idh/MocA family oxidoreductase [Halobacillus fulvus]
MIRFGIIGTNTITEKLLSAAEEHPKFQLTAVFSRTEKRAREFAEQYGASFTFTSLEEMAASKEIDAVYIASPNSFHADQATIFMENGKHVLCEKPLASNTSEVRTMIETAERNNVVLMEAMKSTLMPGFAKLREHLHKVGTIRRYVGNFCKYSSRYDAYKNGKVLNAFNPEYSNGSLMDLGIYGIYPMVVLFGEPKAIRANGTILGSGVDGQGSLLVDYEGMEAVIMHSKIINSYTPSEIQGEKGSILIPNISEPDKMTIHYRDGSMETIDGEMSYEPMYYEVKEFINLIEKGQHQSSVNSLENTRITAEIMEQARKQIGLVYPAD